MALPTNHLAEPVPKFPYESTALTVSTCSPSIKFVPANELGSPKSGILTDIGFPIREIKSLTSQN